MEENRRPIAEPEVHLLPDGFIGQITIQHGRADGAPPAHEGNARLYQIPPGGVLATQAPPNYGIRPPERMRFFRVNASGERELIPPRETAGTEDANSVLACYQVGPDFYYVVDRPANAGQYRNPALRESPSRG
jgi:hypothetical protein